MNITAIVGLTFGDEHAAVVGAAAAPPVDSAARHRWSEGLRVRRLRLVREESDIDIASVRERLGDMP